MHRARACLIHLPLTIAALFAWSAAAFAEDLLSSWNDGAAQAATVDFVTRVTQEGSPGFVPQAQGGKPTTAPEESSNS